MSKSKRHHAYFCHLSDAFPSAWEFYEIQRPEISAIRMTFLLRVLVVDVQPFQILLEEVFGPKGNWQGRCVLLSLRSDYKPEPPLGSWQSFGSSASFWTSQVRRSRSKNGSGGQASLRYFIVSLVLSGWMKR